MRIRPGDQLLQYRVVDKIGSGGMGEVYRAGGHLDAHLLEDVRVAERFEDRSHTADGQRRACANTTRCQRR